MIYVGVDIGSCSVKAVAIKKTGKTFAVLNTHLFSVKLELPEEQKRIVILSHLKTLKDLYKGREAQFIFCFSQNEVSSGTLHFPFKERYKIMKSLPYQMEEKLSLFDHKNLISDIKTNFSEEKKEVLVFSVFKDSVAALLKDLKSINIKPLIFTCEAVATANLFEAEKPEKSAPASPLQPEAGKKKDSLLYLKIGHTHTMALIVSEGKLQDVYSFGWGVSSCIRKIALKYEVPFSKALEQFCEKAFVLTQTRGYTGSQISFAKLIQEAFEKLVDKLQLLLIQLSGEKTFKCSKVLLFGGGAQVRNLQAFLSPRLNVPVSRVQKIKPFPHWNLKTNEEQQNNLITALGCAIEGLKKPGSPALNFLKGEFARQFNPFSFLMGRWQKPLLYGASCLILLFAYSTFRYHQSEKLSDKTHRLFQKKSVQIAKLSPRKVNIQSVKDFLSRRQKINQRTEFIERLSLVPSSLDKLKSLSMSINRQPSWNMEIQEMNIAGHNIEITGEISPLGLKVLEKNLKALAKDKQLKKLNTQTGKTPDKVVFKYSFIIQKQG